LQKFAISGGLFFGFHGEYFIYDLLSFAPEVITFLVSLFEMAPRLVIAASSQSFDQTIISHWGEEGYEVRFEPVRDDSRSSIRSIESIGDSLDSGEKYAIVKPSSQRTLT
jgi:hypothetical protein